LTTPQNINDGWPWSEINDEDLRDIVAEGALLESAAKLLGRTSDDVALRAAHLRLRWSQTLH